MDNFSDKLLRYRWLTIIVFICVTLVFILQIPKVEIDTDIKSQLPKDMPARLDTDKIDSLFGGTDLLMVVIQSDDILIARGSLEGETQLLEMTACIIDAVT